ncbi:ATP-dependent helicase [Corynebacterium halotolerans]|uniref:DNA 3'-5' helicase n=1 Tax=Corynebacterium halotolerans YIM 70093 = DSM 44683 TaxID=1121362 RepID=M1NK43_9CORY|nr:UvrD-helicase domain-containing protein [Corynebacterium halotolerans]AGF71783.1 hypothetical protein A605_03860 [Corynebacterium halotolerans YIM 70093 = DSM 44683]
MPDTPEPKISPVLLSRVLEQKFPPTGQQAAVIGAQPGPLLVVAGAGAGKTETMASRVVWLVANGYATPDEILGLTFTRKAAQELGKRIRNRLDLLATKETKVRDLDPGGDLAKRLTSQIPTVATYDSYAGSLIREYGLLMPVEPAARLITQAELFAIAHEVVTNYRGRLLAGQSVSTVTEYLLALVTEMDNSLATAQDIVEETEPFLKTVEDLPKGPKQRVADYTKTVSGWLDTQQVRLQYLPLVAELKAELARRNVVTFNEQMSVAAKLARDHRAVGMSQRRRFRVVMLDEYQDTSHAQRVLLRSLFGTADPGLTVTAVGDPMQAIYGWRGATVKNLAGFAHDFSTRTGEAPKKELTTSWRNPAEVLQLANEVSDRVFEGTERPVQPLSPRPGAGAGDVALAFFADEDEEIAFVTERMAAEFQAKKDAGERFTGAVLVRKNRHTTGIAEALAERGIPCEIVGLSGLLDVPEVADVVAVATMLIRPQDTTAALRILTGPWVGLGLADLVALQNRARNLAGHREKIIHPGDPVERLRSQLAEVTADPPEQVVGLTDAVADLGERGRYSADGLERLERLSSRLRHLRTYSLPKSLPDLFADIEDALGIRTEVLARGDAAGTVHLDRFAHEVAAYSGDTLSGLLSYLDLARRHEDGLALGEVAVRSDRVQLLTAHKAKGLEWDVVSVLHADAGTYSAKASTFLTNPTRLPDEEFAALAADDRKEFEDLAKDYIADRRAAEAEEAARLFYVALTRSERVLTVTGSGKKPYAQFEHLAEKFPELTVTWEPAEDTGTDTDADTPEPVTEPEPETGTFPHLPVDADVVKGADLVRAAVAELPPQTAGETYDFWEQEVTALIEEYEALTTPVVEVELPSELTATDLVALRADPEAFARRQRRPVPFKPNTYAKRGTAFHQWLEDRFGATALLDEDQLPGIDEEVVHADELEALKTAFLASRWADRTPEFVEQPFEVTIGDAVVRGRMDAVFRDPDNPDGWFIIDWKTGRPPKGDAWRAAEIQLAVYREAWTRIRGTSEPVRAAFHYVGWGETLEPADLPGGDELAALLESATR